MKKRGRSNKRAARNGYRPTSIGESAPSTAKRETKTQCEVDFEDEHKRFMDRYEVLCTNDFSDSEDSEPKPMAALQGEASRDIKELAGQIHRCCSDNKWTSYQKRVACEQLVRLAFLSTDSVNRLAKEFPQPFREIAEELSHFPCLFPAHAEDLPSLKKIIWDKFNLGKGHTFKLRGASRRKTFSKNTWVNRLLLNLIGLVHELARQEHERDQHDKYESTLRHVAFRVPLTAQNAKQWLDVIWALMLDGTPHPENEPRLRQLVQRPSLRTKRMRRDGTVGERTQAHNMRAAIKAKLGLYLKRMLNDSTVTQITP